MSTPRPSAMAIVTPGHRLREGYRGVLCADEAVRAATFVIDGRSGRLALPMTPTQQRAESVVLMVPDERDDALQLLLRVEPLEDWRGAEVCDRHLAYHGRCAAQAWAWASAECVKNGGVVLEPGALGLINPLAGVEPALCKRLNRDRAALMALLERLTRQAIDEPVVVGVDPLGLDVRGAFGVARAPWPARLESVDTAGATVEAWLAGAGG